MAPDTIRRLLRNSPFVPFTLELSSGRRIRVANHDYALVSPSGASMIVYPEGEDKNIDWINPFMITNITVEGGSDALIEQEA